MSMCGKNRVFARFCFVLYFFIFVFWLMLCLCGCEVCARAFDFSFHFIKCDVANVLPVNTREYVCWEKYSKTIKMNGKTSEVFRWFFLLLHNSCSIVEWDRSAAQHSSAVDLSSSYDRITAHKTWSNASKEKNENVWVYKPINFLDSNNS